MKQAYQKPTTAIIDVKISSMLCSSIRGIDGVDLGIENDGTEGAGITTGNSRRGSLWDDDEEEDY